MTEGVRKMFPGGNTSEGFYSFYRYIISEDANRIFILKGGPGVGKSDFMKKVAGEMAGAGFNAELHYCSSDNDSLDAIVIEGLNVALVDGTAPHTMDPCYSGAVDEIINLGDFLNIRALEVQKDRIIALNKQKSEYFARAYKMLAAAGLIADDMEYRYGVCMERGKINTVIKEWSDEIFSGRPLTSIPGKERHMFASAYTPEGFIDYSHTLIRRTHRVYHLKGFPGTGKTYLLSRLTEKAIERGIDVECFHSPLKPYKLHTIVLTEPGITVSCSGRAKAAACSSINLNNFLDRKELKRYKGQIEKDANLYQQLISEATSALSGAKDVHSRLEEYYSDNMNFSAVDGLRHTIVQRILRYG